MKKNIVKIFSFAMAVMALAACSPETDHVFDEDASQRIEEFNSNLKETLISAPNGWRMEYYAATTYGGYNLLLKFTDTSVTAASEKLGSSQPAGFDDSGNLVTATSHYTIDQSMGSILSFDGYNEVIHYYSDPKNPDGIGTDGTGLEGDLEFRVVTVSSDSIIMKGKKHGNTIKMYPIAEGKDWGELLNDLTAVDDYMASSSYEFKVGESETSISVYQSYRNLVFTYKDASDNTKQVRCPYVVTEDGFKFYSTDTINGTVITGFLKGDTDEYFCAMNNSNARIYTYLAPLAEQLETGMWFISYDYLGAYAQPSWDAMRVKLETFGSNKSKERLYDTFIGTYSGKVGLHLFPGGTYIRRGLTITALNDDQDEVNIRANTTNNSTNSTKYYNNAGLKDAMEPFVGSGSGSKGRNFKLTSDSQRHPSYMILTDMDEPTNVIRLFYNEVTYTYGDLDADKD